MNRDYFLCFFLALLCSHPIPSTSHNIRPPVDVMNTGKGSKVSLNLDLQISMDLPIPEKAITWTLWDTLHLNHKFFFFFFLTSVKSVALERLKTHCLGMETSYLSFPRKSKIASSVGPYSASTKTKFGGGTGAILKPKRGGARSPAQETDVLCQPTENILGNACICCPRTSLQNQLSLPIQTRIFSPQRRRPERDS